MDREPLPQFFDASWEAFKNNSSETIPAHSVMRIQGVTSASGRLVYLMGKPNTYGSYWEHRISGPHDVAAGGYGICRINGICAAVNDTSAGNPYNGELWGPRDGSWKLWRDTPGWRVLESSSTGIVYVAHQPQQTLVGKTDGAHNKAVTGTVSIYWSSTGGGSLTDTTVNVSAYNRYGNVDANKFVTLNYNGWGWEIIAAECGA